MLNRTRKNNLISMNKNRYQSALEKSAMLSASLEELERGYNMRLYRDTIRKVAREIEARGRPPERLPPGEFTINVPSLY